MQRRGAPVFVLKHEIPYMLNWATSDALGTLQLVRIPRHHLDTASDDPATAVCPILRLQKRDQRLVSQLGDHAHPVPMKHDRLIEVIVRACWVYDPSDLFSAIKHQLVQPVLLELFAEELQSRAVLWPLGCKVSVPAKEFEVVFFYSLWWR